MNPDPAGTHRPLLETDYSAADPAAPAPGAAGVGASGLLEAVFDATMQGSPDRSRLDAFLAERSPAKALRLWLGACPGATPEQIQRRLSQHIAQLDRLLNQQLDALLHHPRFQRLEASWRGLWYLTGQLKSEDEQAGIKIRVLSASWKELERDFERSTEFDQSQLFRKVYEQEFGMPGGEPFGVLLGDYEIHPRPSAQHPHDDIGILRSIAQVAAAAFCPFVSSVSPAMFGLDRFQSLEQRLDHARTFEQLDYLKWRSFRESEDARFVSLVLPRMLMRLPYEDDGTRVDGFCFQEDVSGRDASKYLWSSAVYALGAVLIRSFSESGWLADIRGVRRGIEAGGLVTGLPAHSFGTDRPGVAVKCSTDVVVTDHLEKELHELGFLPLCQCRDSEYSAFYSNQTVQRPKVYDRPAATLNAKISTMLQYMLCVSRFAHYIKVLGRDKVGSFSEPERLEYFLQNWITRYVTADSEASPDVKARFPLREAAIQVREHPGKPGSYQCVMHLAPHYELDELTATLRVATELTPARPSSS